MRRFKKELALLSMILLTCISLRGAVGSDYPLIIQLLPGYAPMELIEEWKKMDGFPSGMTFERKVSRRKNLYLFSLSVPMENETQALELIQQWPGVSLAYIPHRLESRFKEPNDPLFGDQWHMEIIKAPEVWELSTGGVTANGTEIVVALMDFGFQTNHLDLADNLWKNSGEIPGDGLDNDGNGYTDDYVGLNVKTGNDQHPIDFHGTGTAGLLGARGDNLLGVTGVNWNTKMLLFSPMEYTFHVTEALEYCMDLRDKFNRSNGTEGAFIVTTSLSLGVPDAFPEDSPELMMWCELYEEAGNMGIISVVAGPNSNTDIGLSGDMPSLCPTLSILSVTNSDQTDRKVVDAGYNSIHVDLAAPGDGSFTTYLQNGYREFGGCSASTPHVAGAIGLLYSLPFDDFTEIIQNDPPEAAGLIRTSIMEGVKSLNTLQGVTVSGGRLDLNQAVEKLREKVIDTEFGKGDVEITQITPNPADQRAIISYKTRTLNTLDLTVYNISGQEVYTSRVVPGFSAESQYELIVEGWTPGTYFILLKSSGSESKGTIVVH